MLRFTVFLLGLVVFGAAVDRSKFRTCSQTSFCDRNRNKFNPQHYELDAGSIKVDEAQTTVVADLRNGRHPLQDPLECKITILTNDVVRLSVREKNPKNERSPRVDSAVET